MPDHEQADDQFHDSGEQVNGKAAFSVRKDGAGRLRHAAEEEEQSQEENAENREEKRLVEGRDADAGEHGADAEEHEPAFLQNLGFLGRQARRRERTHGIGLQTAVVGRLWDTVNL